MRTLVFILIALLFSCTAKNKQSDYVFEETLQDSAASKNYVYVDTPVSETKKYFDTVESIVQAPVEEEVVASTETTSNDTIEIDTTVYRWQLAVAPDTVAEWKKMKQFAYVNNLDSLLKAAKEQKQKEVAKREARNKKSNNNKKSSKKNDNSEYEIDDTPPSSSGGGWLDGFLASSGLKFFLWILAGAFVLFVIYKLFVTGSPLKTRGKTLPDKAPQAEEEIITHESDFDRLIRESVQQGNYRLAIRYHYLHTLHTLAQKNYIQLAADKTNYSYVREIADYNKQNEFAGLTLNYEYVWYGEFVIDELVYLKLKPAFQAFNTKI